jgi:hypothetical protein
MAAPTPIRNEFLQKYIQGAPFEEVLDFHVDGLLVRQSGETTDVESTAFFTVTLEMGGGVISLPAIEREGRVFRPIVGSLGRAFRCPRESALWGRFGDSGFDLYRTSQKIFSV